MSKKDKPLPKPPSTPFGRKKSFGENEGKGPLMADKMAIAMSEGKLDEFLQKELPDNEHARKLAEMMMGMTGMMHMGGPSGMPPPKKEDPPEKTGSDKSEEKPSSTRTPEDVVNAVQAGDVSSLMDILKREHRKRQGIAEDEVSKSKQKSALSSDQAVIEKDIIEQMIKIASNNNLTLDWMFFRALKRYVEEYKRTGNL